MPRKKDRAWETEQAIFPSKLSEIMKERQVSQEKLANALGVKRQTVSLYKTGQSSPNVEQLRKIAEFFGVSADWLLDLSKTKEINGKISNICDYTGLSTKAALFLNKASTGSGALVVILKIIDEIVSRGDEIIDYVDKFCVCEITSTDNGEDNREDVEADKAAMVSSLLFNYYDEGKRMVQVPVSDAGMLYGLAIEKCIEECVNNAINEYWGEILRAEIKKRETVLE